MSMFCCICSLTTYFQDLFSCVPSLLFLSVISCFCIACLYLSVLGFYFLFFWFGFVGIQCISAFLHFCVPELCNLSSYYLIIITLNISKHKLASQLLCAFYLSLFGIITCDLLGVKLWFFMWCEVKNNPEREKKNTRTHRRTHSERERERNPEQSNPTVNSYKHTYFAHNSRLLTTVIP